MPRCSHRDGQGVPRHADLQGFLDGNFLLASRPGLVSFEPDGSDALDASLTVPRPLRKIAEGCPVLRRAGRAESIRFSGAPGPARPGRSSPRGSRSAAKRATSVHACFGSTARTPLSTSASTSGWLRFGGAAGLRSVNSTSASPPTNAESSAWTSLSVRSGPKRRFTLSSKRSGITFRPRPPDARVALVTWDHSIPSTSTRSGCNAASRASSGAAF